MPRFQRKKKKVSTMPVKKLALKNSRAISKLKTSIERKVNTVQRVLAAVPAGNQILGLNLMAPGTDWGSRIGFKIRNSFLELNFGIINTNATANRARVMIVFDKDSKGIIFDPDRLWSQNANDFERQTAVKDQVVASEYRVIFDKLIVVSGQANDNSQVEKHFKIRIPLNDSTIYNELNLADESAVERNALYFVINTNANNDWYLNSNLHYFDA